MGSIAPTRWWLSSSRGTWLSHAGSTCSCSGPCVHQRTAGDGHADPVQRVYPYDTATFTGVDTTSMSGGGVGVTAGVDVSYLVTTHVGVGGELRYSYASATLKPSGQPAKVGLGGLQAAFGARILF